MHYVQLYLHAVPRLRLRDTLYPLSDLVMNKRLQGDIG